MSNTLPFLHITSEEAFQSEALKMFHHQFEQNSVYRSFCDLLYIHPSSVQRVEDIPFLPIGFFKTHHVVSTPENAQKVFSSSGTSNEGLSRHYVHDLDLYESSFIHGFERMYGPVEDYVILGLLPSYLERQGSSLVYMVERMIQKSKHSRSGFYLNNYKELFETLQVLEEHNQKTLLIGVSFALLDFAEKFQLRLNHTLIMETGGMKGRRKEMIRAELHSHLKEAFGVESIHSEYGMTELLSQAYSKGNGLFETPPWMRVFIRDPEDPLSILKSNKTGGINIIDLANQNSCSFIATQDLGKIKPGGKFEVLGRFDHAEIRGCSLMVTG